MWSAIGAWLINLGIQDALSWFKDWLSALIASEQDVKNTHQADTDQANQDMQKAEALPPKPTAEQETDAGSDALSHL